MTINLIHITPELPPAVGGVADYTRILSRRLVEVSERSIEPVLIHAGHRPAEAVDVEFPVENLSGQCSASVLAQTIERLARNADTQVVVLLEYSGYGYAKRGAPLWLARGLRQACDETGLPLITMFHEISASGPFWSSSFWLSFVQRHVARNLADRSCYCCSNRSDSVKWLRSHSSTSVRHGPVFSNVGEAEEWLPRRDRDSFAVVFGGAGKDALYRDHGDALVALLQSEGIRKIIDVGPQPSPSLLPSASGLEIICKGITAPSSVSRHLQTARLGLVCRNPAALTKSGSLAAYLAHGLPAVVARRHSSATNPHLTDGIHYLSLRKALDIEPDGSRWDTIGKNGWAWYNECAHSRRAADTFLELITSACGTHL
jgi:hypothetical protein